MSARIDSMADMAVETGRLRAALEAREAEVAWLRAWHDWALRELDRAEIRGELQDDPEPQPPDGVRPMHTIDNDCWCHVCTQAQAEYRLRADRAEERLALTVMTIAAANGSIAHERDKLAARMASVLTQRDALTARLSEMWWAAWCGIWPVVGHGMEVWEYDGHWERRLAAVEAERDAARAHETELEIALGHAVAMLCACGGTGGGVPGFPAPCGQPACAIARAALGRTP